RRYNKFRRYAVLLSFIGGALMSPGGDVFLMLLLTLPLLLLYEIGVAGSYLVQRRKPAESIGGGSGTTAAMLIATALVVASPAALAAQDTLPARVPLRQQVDTLRGQQARQMDTSTAKRLGLPTAPERSFPSADSLMSVLLRRPGFA